MAFILGKKIKMTQIWDGERVFPATIIQAGPAKITQIRSNEKDGYEAVQIGFDATKKKLNKSLARHLEKLGNFRYLKEFRVKNPEFKVGDILDVSKFNQWDKIKVSGISKGKGFQGVVKRHGFGGGPTTHGQKNRQRASGSIGSTAPQRVLKGRKMAGRMGGKKVTIKNLKIIGIDKENNLLIIGGAVPGAKGTILKIESIK